MEEKKIGEYPFFTPEKWQTVILKNYGMVPPSSLAKVLSCPESVIIKEAKRLGIESLSYSSLWLEKSYITIVKNNWHLLPLDQICLLLNKDREWLEAELINNDFLFVKLGYFKPECEPVSYAPLTEKDIKETKKIKRVIKKHIRKEYALPFSFQMNPISNSHPSSYQQIVYPYSAPYGDILASSPDLVSEDDLKKMQSVGINGIWFQGLLSLLSAYPFDGKNDQKYLTRRKNLAEFIAKAKKYGIGVYLYLNEPRAIKETDLLPEFAYLKGRKEGELTALCFSFRKVQNYLYKALKDLLMAVPDIAGIMSITSSENLTHCQHISGSECPYCQHTRPVDTAVRINNIMEKAIHDADVKTELIANLWGWTEMNGYSEKDIRYGIRKMHPEITVLCVSEFGHHHEHKKHFEIDEYSLSHGLPCEETKTHLAFAEKCGHKVMGKVQVNNSWEMASVPYLPVFELVIKNMKALRDLGVKDYFLSWTLGGYPSVVMNLIDQVVNHDVSYEEWLKKVYGGDAIQVKKAVHQFSLGFSYYPFSQHLLYYGPMNLGPANLLYPQATGLEATMVGFPYDDTDKWLGQLDKGFFISSIKKMIRCYQKGLKELIEVSDNPFTEEIRRFALAFLTSLQSTLNQYLMVQARNRGEAFSLYFRKEKKLTEVLFTLASEDARIGFEASNQYLYGENHFLEKFLNLYQLSRKSK